MMNLKIDPQRGIPLYYQIMEQIKHLIATGQLKENDQLPTVRQLAVDLEINPHTVAKAYNELMREGILDVRQGIGTFVRSRQKALDSSDRQKKLDQLCDAFLTEAMKYGFTKREIIENLQKRSLE